MNENTRDFDEKYYDKLISDDDDDEKIQNTTNKNRMSEEEQMAAVLMHSEEEYETEMIFKQLAEIERNTRIIEERLINDKIKRSELFEIVLRRLPYSGLNIEMREEVTEAIKLYKNLIINTVLLSKESCEKFKIYLKEIMPKLGESTYNEIVDLLYLVV